MKKYFVILFLCNDLSFSQPMLNQPNAVGGGINGIGQFGTNSSIGAFSSTNNNIIRSYDPLPPPAQGGGNILFLNNEINKLNDFQKFVLETTGYKLSVYGNTFFENLYINQRNQLPGFSNTTPQSPFQPIETSSVSADYIIGPGDQLIMRGWGSLEIDVKSVVDRNGMIHIPKVGTISIGGVIFSKAENLIKSHISKFYKDFSFSLTMGQLHNITIYVVGNARRPGSYSLSSVSTLSTALFATGGPSNNGSLRQIQLKRNNNLIKSFDLYNFLSKGNNLDDIKLIDGDVLYFPQATGYVAIIGKVNNPAIYEIKDKEDTLEDLLKISGGLAVTANSKKVNLERLSFDNPNQRNIEELTSNNNGFKKPLVNGDILTFLSASPLLANAVTLRGNIAYPQRVQWKNGMRISDLIPSKDILVSSESIIRQNESIFDKNQKERTLREREFFPFDLLDDPELDKRVDIKSIREAQTKTRDFNISEQSMSNNSILNSRNLNDKNSDSRSEYTERIPNNYETFREARITRLFSNQKSIILGDQSNSKSFADNIGNLFDEINWEYAVIERINPIDLSLKLIPFNLEKIINNKDHEDNILLLPRDVINIFSANDIRIPISKRRIIVRIEGEVNKPGVYQVTPNDNLHTLITKAGGLTHDAYLYGSSFYRDEVKKSQTINLEKLFRRLEAESSSKLAQTSQSLGATSDAAVSQARILAAQQSQRQALERIKSIKPEGRISLGLEPGINNYVNNLPSIKLNNGDRFLIPNRPDFIYIYGAVNTESALIYQPNLSVRDYLLKAGIGSGADQDSVILIRADGSAITNNASWLNAVYRTKVMPGDSIVVPDKLDREATWSSFIRNSKDITQILYQLGLGAAGLKALGY